MKELDLKSTLVAGLIGAGLLLVIDALFVVSFEQRTPAPKEHVANLVAGFVLGAGVQIGVRLTGVS
jgi:hypothetical protein